MGLRPEAADRFTDDIHDIFAVPPALQDAHPLFDGAEYFSHSEEPPRMCESNVAFSGGGRLSMSRGLSR
jgi:hypothetical protein